MSDFVSPPGLSSARASIIYALSYIFRLSFLHACLERERGRFENKFWPLDEGRGRNYWNRGERKVWRVDAVIIHV